MTAWCDTCGKDTTHYPGGGRCRGCAARESHGPPARAWCDQCGKETSRFSLGACHGCARRKAHAARTPEQRSASARKSQQSRTPESRARAVAVLRAWQATSTPEQRSAAARKGYAAITRDDHARRIYAAWRGQLRGHIGRKAALVKDLEARLDAMLGKDEA